MTIRAPARRTAEAGFTLLEVLLALGVIAVVMAGVGVFFVRSMAVTNQQGDRQVAAQYAADLMERIRERPGCTLIQVASTGYRPCAPYFILATALRTRTIGGVDYARTWSATKVTVDGAPMLTVTATVTWDDSRCPGGVCHYATTTLVSAVSIDPTFHVWSA